MSKIKNDGLDQYGAGLFEQQQFGIVGVEGVKTPSQANKRWTPADKIVLSVSYRVCDICVSGYGCEAGELCTARSIAMQNDDYLEVLYEERT